MKETVLLEKIRNLEKALEQKEAKIQSLEEAIRILRKTIFGRSSEKRNFDAMAKEQSSLFNEAENTILEGIKSPGLFSEKEHEKPGGRNPIPPVIPRIEEPLLPDEKKLTCRHCHTKLKKIGEEITEKLEVIPEKIYVRKIVRPKYKCPCCETEPAEIIIEPLPVTLLPKAAPGAGFMAYAIKQKYFDRIPYYHYAKNLGYAGVDISRWDLSRWSMDVFEKHLEKPLDSLRKSLFRTDYIQGDETRLKVLELSGTQFMWTFHGKLNEKKIAFYHYLDSRSAGFLREWLKDFSGVFQSDGYGSYDAHLNSMPNVIHAGCNVHARRKFTECEPGPEADHVLAEYSKLYKIESELEKANAPPDEILRVRREKSLSILQGLRDTMNRWGISFRPGGNFGKAVKYFLNEYEKLIVYIDYPHVRPDTNLVENDIRPFAVGRKCWLFSGNEAGARASAGYYTLVQTANLNGWDPYQFLLDLFLTIESAGSYIDLVDFISRYKPVRP